MSAAVAEPVAADPLTETVQTPKAVRLFAARRENLMLTKVGVYPVRDANGQQIDMKPGEKVEFQGGRFEVPTDGGEVALKDGRRVEAGPILEWLGRHPLNGDMQEGFWEVNLAAPAPSQRELEALQTMALELDADGLAKFVEAEKAGWAREELLAVAEGTLERVRAREAEQQAQIEARAQEIAAAAGTGSGKPTSKDEPPKGASGAGSGS